jgi:D-lactate dehydrogenase (cytochrome)
MNREENLELSVSPTLFIEFHGITIGQLSEVLEMAEEVCRAQGCLQFRSGLGRAERDRIFKARHGLGETIIRNHPGCRVLSTDVAVPNTRYPELIKTIHNEVGTHKITGYTLSHAGDGNVHLVVAGKKGDRKEWAKIDRVVNTVVTRALDLGGTATGEHGVGIGKRKYMVAEHGFSLQWMLRLKLLFDPNGILNPGKIFPEGLEPLDGE